MLDAALQTMLDAAAHIALIADGDGSVADVAREAPRIDPDDDVLVLAETANGGGGGGSGAVPSSSSSSVSVASSRAALMPTPRDVCAEDGALLPDVGADGGATVAPTVGAELGTSMAAGPAVDRLRAKPTSSPPVTSGASPPSSPPSSEPLISTLLKRPCAPFEEKEDDDAAVGPLLPSSSTRRVNVRRRMSYVVVTFPPSTPPPAFVSWTTNTPADRHASKMALTSVIDHKTAPLPLAGADDVSSSSHVAVTVMSMCVFPQ